MKHRTGSSCFRAIAVTGLMLAISGFSQESSQAWEIVDASLHKPRAITFQGEKLQGKIREAFSDIRDRYDQVYGPPNVFSEARGNLSEIPWTSKGWSLEALQFMAIEASFRLQAARNRILSSERGVRVAKLKDLPQISLSAGFDDYREIAATLTFAEPQPYKLFTFGGSLKFNLTDHFRKGTEVLVATRDMEVERAKLARERLDLLEKFTNAYFDAADAKANIDLYTSSLEIQQAQLAIVKERHSHRAATMLEVKDAQVEMAVTGSRLEDWKSRYEKALGTMSEYLHVQRDFWNQEADFDIAQEEPEELKESEVNIGMETPETRYVETQLEKARAEVRQIRLGMLPTVYAKADFEQTDKDGFSMDDTGKSYTVSLKMDWTLSDAFTIRQRELKKKIEAKALASDLLEARNAQSSKLRGLLRDYHQGRIAYELKRSVAELQDQRLIMIHEEQESGIISTIEYNEAYVKKQQADADTISASIQFQRASALINLHRAFSKAVQSMEKGESQ